jgi:transposase-like protein
MKVRKTYDPKFRAKVALEAIKGTMTLGEITKQYKIHHSVVIRWKNELLEKLPLIFSKDNDITLAETIEKNEELYKEIGKLEMEVKYLKKKLLY